jgi:hypothetical protein
MNNLCYVPSHFHTTYSLCIRYLYKTLTCSRMSLGVSLLSFVCLAATSSIGTPSFIYIYIYIYIYMYIYKIPVSWIYSLYVLFCFEAFYASLFSYAVCNCDQSFLNIDTVNACSKELGEGGWNSLRCMCEEFILC